MGVSVSERSLRCATRFMRPKNAVRAEELLDSEYKDRLIEDVKRCDSWMFG